MHLLLLSQASIVVHRSIHWKRLILVLVVTGVVGGGLVALNRVQGRRQAAVIKTVAERAEAAVNGDIARRAEAIDLYEQYLRFQPDDELAGRRYADLLIDQYKAQPNDAIALQAIHGIEGFLRRFPDHPTHRRELAAIYLKSGRIPSAREHLAVLLNSSGRDLNNDVELREMTALCAIRDGDLTEATQQLRLAIDTKQAPVRIYQQALELLHRNKADSRREVTIAEYVRTLLEDPRFKNNLEARIAAARFELFRGEIENARRDIQYALESIPGGKTNAEALLAAAELNIVEARIATDSKIKTAKLKEAQGHLQSGFAADSKNVSIGVLLAKVLSQQGKIAEAIEVLRTTAEALGQVNDQFLVVIDHLIDLGNQDVATVLVQRVARDDKLKLLVNYFRGRLALLEEDWLQAKELLEAVEPQLKLPEFHKRAMVGLGKVYAVLQNPDKQLECNRAALKDDGIYLPALIGEADALAKLGNLEEAITRYQALVTIWQLPEYRVPLVRLRLLDTLRKPLENRNWTRFDSEETLGPAEGRSDEIQILHAQALAARGEKARAIEILTDIRNKNPQSPAATAALVNLVRIKEAGKPEAALAILDEAQQQVGDTVDLRLAKADVLIYRAKPPSATEFEALSAGAEKFLAPEQFRLWLGLGQAALAAISRVPEGPARSALIANAIRFLQTAARLEPRDLLSRSILIDITHAPEYKSVREATLEELAILEGPNGPISTLARVSIRLPEVARMQQRAVRDAELKELRRLVQNVQQQRPGWGRVYVALARIDELEGLTEQAVENYRRALKEGDREEYVIRRAVDLYRERNQDALAAALLQELSTRMTLPDDLERFRTIHEMLNRIVPRSEKPTIERIAPLNTQDYRILLLRGALLAAIRDDDEALVAFRRAVEIAHPPVPETWLYLIGQLVRTGQVDAAKQALAEAEHILTSIPQKTNAARAELLVTLGRSSELVGDLQQAATKYRAAVQVAPEELNPHRRLIEFLMRTGHAAEAEALLIKLTNEAGQDIARWARRYRAAVVLMSRPDRYHQRGVALDLIAKNLQIQPPDPDDVKAQAVIWTVDPVTRDEGVKILKEFWARGELTPDESFLLGRLTFDLGPSKIPDSLKYFESAARPRQGVSIDHLVGLFRVHLALSDRGHDLSHAEAVLERIQAAAPRSWEATREEAHLVMKKSRAAVLRADHDEAKRLAEQARALILKFPGHDSLEAIRHRTGPLLEELGFLADAETLYRKLLSGSDTPTAHLPLAILYIRQKKSAEAIALAWKHEVKVPPSITAQLLTGAVQARRPGDLLEREVEQWLEKRIAEAAGKPEQASLIGSRGDLLGAQSKYKEAIAEYRRALAVGQSDKTVNNLAMLLALFEPARVDEAIRMMSDLIAVHGPVPMYLDTRAVAYIVKGGDYTAKAVEDLEMALLQRASPVYFYHLAWAFDLQLKRVERQRRIEEALRLGLTLSDLHPLERETYHRLLGPDAK